MRSFCQPASPSELARSSYIYLAFTLDYAIEFPLFLAYHPTTLAFPNNVVNTIPLPTLGQSAAQVLVFFFWDWAFQFYVMRFLSLPNGREESGPKDPEDDDAFHLALEFIRPRGAVLIAIAIIGTPSPLNSYTGKLHVLSMVSWIVLRQLGGLLASHKLKKLVGA